MDEDKEIEELQRRFDASVALVHPDNYPEYYDISKTNILFDITQSVHVNDLSDDMKHYLYLTHERDLMLRKSRRLLREMKVVKKRLLNEWKDNYTFKVKPRYESKLMGQNFTLKVKRKHRALTLSEFQRFAAKQLAERMIVENFNMPRNLPDLTELILHFFYSLPIRVQKRDMDIVRNKYKTSNKRKRYHPNTQSLNRKAQKQPMEIVNVPKRHKIMQTDTLIEENNKILIEELSDEDESIGCPDFLDESKF